MPKITQGSEVGKYQATASPAPRSDSRSQETCSQRGIKPKESHGHRDSQPWKGDTAYFLQRNQQK